MGVSEVLKEGSNRAENGSHRLHIHMEDVFHCPYSSSNCLIRASLDPLRRRRSKLRGLHCCHVTTAPLRTYTVNFSTEAKAKLALCKKLRRFPSLALFSCDSVAFTLLFTSSVHLYFTKELVVRTFSSHRRLAASRTAESRAGLSMM